MSNTTPRDSPKDPEEESRSTRKRTAILEAATTVFLRSGYLGTSMDEIASLASVSKHFADKERLFCEIVDPNYSEVLNLKDSGDVEADLRDLVGQLPSAAAYDTMKPKQALIPERTVQESSHVSTCCPTPAPFDRTRTPRTPTCEPRS